MKTITYTVKDPMGIHARPAGSLVKEAQKYQSDISVIFGDKKASAKKIFGIMGLSVKQNDTFEIHIEGPDEEKAEVELNEFLKNNL